MPAHSVELSHMVLLSVTVQDTGNSRPQSRRSLYLTICCPGLSPSDFAIINGDGRSDFDQEAKLTLVDGHKRGLDLRLNYV
jgi:vacuolar protein sorting-associated protein 13A/C